jgi:hypothetical protein
MKKVFVSYRREDSQHQAGRLYDRLVNEFGVDNLFYDVESIEAGADWQRLIDERLDDSDVLIALIGDVWLQEFKKRETADDVLALELQTAMAAGVPIIPVLVGRSPMPQKSELPPSLELIATFNAMPVRPGADFHPDVDRLIEALRRSQQSDRAMLHPADDPTKVALEYAQEQMAAIYRWRWYTTRPVLRMVSSAADHLVGASAQEQLRIADQVWPNRGIAETHDGKKWTLFSQGYDGGPGRELYRDGCLALYVFGGVIEGVTLQYSMGWTSSGMYKSETLVSAGAEFGDLCSCDGQSAGGWSS